MEENKSSGGINIGGASVIMVFAVLCLTVFAVLTLLSANSERKLAVKTAESQKDYYAAETALTKTAGEISYLAQTKGTAAVSAYLSKNGYTYTQNGSEYIVKMSRTIDDSRRLDQTVTVSAGSAAVTSLKVVTTKQFTPDETVSVWDGKTPVAG